MIFIDLTHTSHTRARTGIQRVCRGLHRALANRTDVQPLTHDPFRKLWRPLAAWEMATLAANAPARKRSAHWPWHTRWAGRMARVLRRPAPTLGPASGLIVPEIFSPAVAQALPALFQYVSGPRVAVFHDAIALRFPELTPPQTVARFPAYLHELLAFDGIAAISEDSRQTLLDYWAWLGVENPPPVVAIPLGLDQPNRLPTPAAAPEAGLAGIPTILCVSSIEARKNHLSLLDAAENLWQKNLPFSLKIIGMTQQQTGITARERMHALQQAGRPLHYAGAVDEATLQAAYARCAFTVYPSLAEGFGLPVLESLAHGKPCICASRGALGEAARGGGCLTLPTMDAANIAAAMERLLVSSDERESLVRAARQRVFRTWDDYAADLHDWLEKLRSSAVRV